jgi:hypothetical protein
MGTKARKSTGEMEIMPRMCFVGIGDFRSIFHKQGFLCRSVSRDGCQMVYFQAKNTNLGKFWRALHWKILKCFMAIWNILQTFGIFYDHSVHFVFIWCIFPVLVSCAKKEIWQPCAQHIVRISSSEVRRHRATWNNMKIAVGINIHTFNQTNSV